MNTSFLDAAQSELEETINHYEEQRPGLGLEFGEEIYQALERIKHYPEAWTPLSPQVRRCLVNRFPYSVIYEVRGELLIVVAIQNHQRKPESWRSRVK